MNSVNKVMFFSDGRVDMKVVPVHDDTHLIYLLENTLIPNGDGEGTTDWINPTNGLAEYWTISTGPV